MSSDAEVYQQIQSVVMRTQRGQVKLVVNDRHYYCRSKHPTKTDGLIMQTWWCCTTNCRGSLRRLVHPNGHQFGISDREDCHPDPVQVTNRKAAQMFRETHVTANDGQFEHHARTARRHGAEQYGPVPQSYNDLTTIPSELVVTDHNNERYLLFFSAYDDPSSDEEKKIICVSSDKDLRALFTAKRVHIDGTFKVVPLPFCGTRGGQLVTISTLFGEQHKDHLYCRSCLPSCSQPFCTKSLSIIV
eukprot:CAMPEP_0175027096 /NCGR_PEP_ID=MMETSP0005-20121125/18147_1 /TAXON_ID=420556 /ORGANISM="Ochromonas sp., Strain CCMP1393" /LENGTH=244 /DNA_ID=CAMNT_0016286351 /DNA_START=119 /DNA_END=853 /DNA_ORIENTATION=+